MTARITKSRDTILAALKASFGEAVNAMCKTVEVDDYVRAIEECDSIRDQITERGKLFRPKRVRKADRKATEFRRIVAYVAAQPAGFRNHVPSTAMSIENTRHAAHYRAELIEWRLFTQRNVGVREAFGYGYGAGDIEHMFEIFTARNLWFLKHNNDNPHIAKATEDAINAMTAGRRPAPVMGTAMDAAIEEARRKRDG